MCFKSLPTVYFSCLLYFNYLIGAICEAPVTHWTGCLLRVKCQKFQMHCLAGAAVPQAADHRTKSAFSFGALGRDRILGSEQGAVFNNIAPNCMWAVNSESKSPLLFTWCCVQMWVFKGTRACSLLVLGASALSDYYFSKQSHFFLQLGSLVKEMKMWICGMVPTYALKIWF